MASTFKKIVAHEISPRFRQSTHIATVPFASLTESLSATSAEVLLINNHYVGINASDVNYVNGKYMPGVQPPFDVGFEAIGEVVDIVGGGHHHQTKNKKSKIQKKDIVVTQCFGAFAEYQAVPTRYAKKVKKLDAGYLPLDLSGTTASMCLEYVLQPKILYKKAAAAPARLTPEEVLAQWEAKKKKEDGSYYCPERAVVAAAAGGTGQFAAQLLKRKYNCACVLGLCSSDSKADFLTGTLGLDGAINYKKAWQQFEAEKREKGGRGDFATCMSAAISDAFNAHQNKLNENNNKKNDKKLGANLVYESVGGDLLEAMISSLALYGRIASIGSISSYTSGWKENNNNTNTNNSEEEKRKSLITVPRGPLPLQLLAKSASLHTFLLPHYARHAPQHFQELCTLWEAGVIQSVVDDSQQFSGVEGVYDAVDYMYAGKNCGKVIVKL